MRNKTHSPVSYTHLDVYKRQALDTAITVEDMDVPDFRLHPLKGDKEGLWAIDVSKNWRITFEFEDGNAYVVNYEDYH